MASVDLYGDAANQIRNAYKPFRPDGPNDDEVSNWLTGAYGHGDANNLSPVLAAIAQSHEGRNTIPQRPPARTPDVVGQPRQDVSTSMPVPPPQPYRNLDYWQQQGVGYGDIFDLGSGQIRPGWQRTSSGYERAQPSPQGGNHQQWLMSRLGAGPSSPEALGALEAELSQRGIKLQKDSYGVIRGRLYMPDGSTVDVVPPGGWGQPWTWVNRGTGGGSGGGGPQGPADQFNDPYTQFLEQVIKQRIGNLGPVNDPFRDQYMQAMQRRTQALNAAEPQYQDLRSRMNQRITDLDGPGYTGAENEAIRTGALDPIERDRTAAKKRMLEHISARGFTPDSGVAQQLLNEVDREFDSMRAQTQTQLTTNDLSRREGRRASADRMTQGLYDVEQGRQREQLDTFSGIDALSALMRNENDAREREQISLSGALADLGPQRLQLAMQAMGAGGVTPASAFQSLMQLAQLNQNSALLNAQNSQRTWSNIGYMWANAIFNAGR